VFIFQVVPRRGVSTKNSSDLSNDNPNKGRLFRANRPGRDLKEGGPKAGKPMDLR